ncbi:MAG: DUF2914 domain-containing protein [Desulfamplus sp.]|nr:DUF2914 domain-containing protein [Desulfamplus sp.]MBF0243235.1 DUF2914 domain-containing protein [Desulfamplus sp.]MBF0390510.1 DUF2914 domain-containing protein [Desulfamplus sp.]
MVKIKKSLILLFIILLFNIAQLFAQSDGYLPVAAPLSSALTNLGSRDQNLATTQDKNKKNSQETSSVLVLTEAVMCESIKGFEPGQSAVVFSVSLGKIFCFTGFENISQNAFVYHKWYHRDRFVATNRFLVKAPQWSTFSTMQLRSADKGPWRVEITDEKDRLLETLRFSVVD